MTSSPHTRGCFHGRYQWYAPQYVFPAYAGVFLIIPGRAESAGGLPRIRGGVSEFDALVSFTFNCGAANLRSLLRNGRRNRSQIAATLPLYRKAGGKLLKGLERRRAAEKALFLER